MTRYSGRTLIEQPSVGSWGQPATGIGVVGGYGVATGTPTPSASYTDGGFTWQRISFTGTSTLVVSTAGLFDVLLIGGGGGGGMLTTGGNAEGGGGGGAGQFVIETIYLAAATYTITVGAGGAAADYLVQVFGGNTAIGTVKLDVAGGIGGAGPWGTALRGYNGAGASYRAGYGGNAGAVATGFFGFNGGSSDGSGNNGGGGGMGGAGGTRTAGIGLTSTFTGTSTTYCAGGLGGGTSGAAPIAGPANTGNGGGGGISNSTAGANGGTGFACFRFRV